MAHRKPTPEAEIVGERQCELCGETISLIREIGADGEPRIVSISSGCPGLPTFSALFNTKRKDRK